MMQVLLEIQEFALLDRIHQDEERKGIYDVPFHQSEAEYKAETEIRKSNCASKKLMEDIEKNDHSDDTTALQLDAAEKAAWASGVPPYYPGAESTKPSYGYPKYSFEGSEPVSVCDMLHSAAHVQAKHRLKADKDSIILQKGTFSGAAYAASARVVGILEKRNWDNENREFARRRTKESRRIQDIKCRAATDPDGCLNFAKRVVDIQKRFHQDFRDAVARLKKVSVGLDKVYGYQMPLPVDESSLNYFDDCLLWTRRTIQWLIRFSRQDQSFVLPVSIRQQLTDAGWAAGYAARRWELDVPADVFSGMAHVRLRGLGSVARGKEDFLWHLEVQVPKAATIYHLDRRDRPAPIEVDQSMVPPCRLARVASRSARLEPDVTGVTALHNASPIGKWTIRLLGSVPTFYADELTDIVLDLHLTFRARRGDVKQSD